MHVAQCALGIRVLGEQIRKLTTLWASSWILLKPFEGVKCKHKSHGILQGKGPNGINKTRMAQAWPAEMCAGIVQGLINLIQAYRKGHRYFAIDTDLCHMAFHLEPIYFGALAFPMHEEDGSEGEEVEIPPLHPTEGRLMTTAKKKRMEGLTIGLSSMP